MITEFLFEIASLGLVSGFCFCMLAFVLSVILSFTLNFIRRF